MNRTFPDRRLVEVALCLPGGVGHDKWVSAAVAVGDLEGQPVRGEKATNRQFSDAELRKGPRSPGWRNFVIGGEVNEKTL